MGLEARRKWTARGIRHRAVTIVDPVSKSVWAEPDLQPIVSLPSPEHGQIEISVILPCLNEEASVAACVESAREVLHLIGKPYEVIVVDNGSTDRSAAIAGAAGARVIREPVPGYGSACRAGLAAAHGRYLVLGDADGTYDFSEIPRLLARFEGEVDMVLGNRLQGQMEPGAMPWLHRRLGTPLLTGVVNVLFGSEVGDVNCGIRAMTRSAYAKLDIRSTGMEFASEMVVRMVQSGFTMEETPVAYRRRSGGEAKLRTWRDGWRHLRLVVGSWLSQRRHPDAPVIDIATTHLTIDLEGADGPDADRLRL